MKDKRNVKIQQHFDLFINNKKFKVLSCKIDREKGTLSIRTKIFGQKFPHNGHFAITIPSQNTTENFSASFQLMAYSPSNEHWMYTIEGE